MDSQWIGSQRSQAAMRIGVPSSCYISFLGSILLVSIGSIDPGNWATSIEAGSRFGYELVWIVVLSNLIALLLHSLAAHLGVVSGKHLAQAFHDEYPSGVCLALFFISELSLLALDSAMVLSSAVGLNLVLGLPVFVGALIVALDVFLLMGFVPFLGPGKAEVILGVIVVSMVLVFVLNAFVSRPSVLPILWGMWPRLKSDNLYALVGLLGASVVPHNLYLKSALAQEHRKPGQICCTPTILEFILTAAMPIVINLAVMVIAASTFHSAGFAVLTLQDGYVVMEQALNRSVAPLVFGFALLCAGVFSTLTGTLVGQLLSEGLVGKRVDPWLHRLVLRIVALCIALFSAWTYGNEGAYQLLLLSQIIHALQLPFTLVPLVRLTSSAAYMGKNKISSLLEVLSWTALALVLSLDVGFLLSTLFSQSEDFGSATSWELSTGTDSNSVTVPVALTVVTASFGFLVWLVFAPIRSDSVTCSLVAQDGWNDVQPVEKPVSTYKLRIKDVGLEADGKLETGLVAADCDDGSETCVLKTNDPLQESKAGACESLREEEEASNTATSSGSNACEVFTSSSSGVPDDYHTVGDDTTGHKSFEALVGRSSDSTKIDRDANSADKDEADGWENLEHDSATMSSNLSSTCEDSESSRSVIRRESKDGSSLLLGSEGGSLSRLSGLGRASRRQFAATLDEFWGRLFDFHGQMVGSEVASAGSKTNVSHSYRPPSTHFDSSPLSVTRHSLKRDLANKSCFLGSSLDPLGRAQSNLAASTSQSPTSNRWCFDYGSSYSIGDQRYSSLRSFSSHEDLDCQPATIHGYNIASHTRAAALEQSNARARSLHLDIAPRSAVQLPSSYYIKSSFDQSDNSRVFEGDTFATTKAGQQARGIDDESFGRLSRSTDYDSGQWSSFSSNSVDKWNPLVYRATGELDKSLLSHPIGRSSESSCLQSERATLSFDDISPSQTHRDGFSIQAASRTESLWSRPVEQLFGAPKPATAASSSKAFRLSNGVEFGMDTLEQLRLCVRKLLQQEGSEWLFQADNGCDEDLIAGVAAREKSLLESESGETASVYSNGASSLWSVGTVAGCNKVPHCGDACVWGSGLLVSFGVWCIHRVLELALMESRPELWGKYTYVLNRLQGILEAAFVSPRSVLQPCICLQGYPLLGKRGESCWSHPWSWGRNTSNASGKPATASLYLDMIKEVEMAVGSRKGRTGTAAGDVAFPKGKENLASVLKRYKRRLGNKSGSCNRR